MILRLFSFKETPHGHCRLNLGSLMPLVEAGDTHHLSFHLYRISPSLPKPNSKQVFDIFLCLIIVFASSAGFCIATIPGPHPCVHIAGTHARNKQERTLSRKTGQTPPVFPARTICEPVRCKVSIEPVKASLFDVSSMLVLDKEAKEDSIQDGVSHAKIAFSGEKTRPLLWGQPKIHASIS